MVAIYEQPSLFASESAMTLEDAFRQADDLAEQARQRRVGARNAYKQALMVRGKTIFDHYRPLNDPDGRDAALDALVQTCVAEFQLMELQHADEAAAAARNRLYDLLYNRYGPYDDPSSQTNTH